MTCVIFCIRNALALAVVLTAAVAAPGSAAAETRALKPLTLQLNWKHQFQFAGYYIAIEKGYYRREGLDVRLVEAQEGRDPADEVLSGNAEFGVAASELALRKGRGDPLMVLAVILQHSPLVLIARGTAVQSLHELLGKRVMLMRHETEHNRRYLDDMLERELSRARRHGYPLSMVLVDLDNFKTLNDTYGHQAGDAYLQAVAALLSDGVRAGDMVCRWGGEEFALVLPNMSLKDAQQRTESWLAKVRALRVQFGEFELKTTLSAGIAAYPDNGRAPTDLIKVADDALYEAKHAGRDCVRLAAEASRASVAQVAPRA